MQIVRPLRRPLNVAVVGADSVVGTRLLFFPSVNETIIMQSVNYVQGMASNNKNRRLIPSINLDSVENDAWKYRAYPKDYLKLEASGAKWKTEESWEWFRQSTARKLTGYYFILSRQRCYRKNMCRTPTCPVRISLEHTLQTFRTLAILSSFKLPSVYLTSCPILQKVLTRSCSESTWTDFRSWSSFCTLPNRYADSNERN